MVPKQLKYYISIIVFYFFICAYLLFRVPEPFSYYSFHKIDLIWLFTIGSAAILSLVVLNQLFRYGYFGLNRKKIIQFLWIIFYAVILIAIPEEIIFRGLIQNYIQTIVSNTALAVILSALVFGIAHVLNGAQGPSPKQWNWKLAALTFVAGIYLGITYSLTKSLVIPTTLHALLIVANKIFIKD